MKKLNFWQRLLLCFVVVLPLMYLNPFFKADKQQVDQTVSNEQKSAVKSPAITTSKVKKLKTKGLARYIGVSTLSFRETFGEPLQTFASAENIEWQQYGTSASEYMLVGSDQNTEKIVTIYTVGKSSAKNVLQVGMSLKKLRQKVTLSSNFKLSLNEQVAQLKLSANDLVTHPLVAFKNGSYAISYFDSNTKKITAIAYVAKNELLRSQIYRVSSQTPLPVQYSSAVDWNAIQLPLQSSTLALINIKRNLAKKEPYMSSTELNEVAKKISMTIDEKPQKYFSKKQMKQYRLLKSERLVDATSLLLTSKTKIKQLLKDAGVDPKSYGICYGAPVTAPTQLLTGQTKISTFWQKLIYADASEVGIYYDKACLTAVYRKKI